MFRGDLFVTIAEIHMLNIDVCVCIHTRFLFYLFDHLDFFEKAKKWYALQWQCCYNP